MNTLHSTFRPLLPVSLPFAGRQSYMHTFDLSSPLMAPGYHDYLDIVRELCEAAGVYQGQAHMTVDEKVVRAGGSQRRPGPHVDGCFRPSADSWYHGGGSGGWLHGCNNIPTKEIARMPVIVVASAAGCRAWEGDFVGEPKSDGDLSHIADQLGKGTVLEPNVGYLLSPDCVHESMLLDKDTQRTFLRIALPNTFKGF